MRRKKKNKFKSTVIYVLVITLLSLGAYAYRSFSAHLQTITSRFELEDIKITGNTLLSRTQILQIIGLKKGESLLSIQVDKVAGKLLASPFIRGAGAVYSLPSTLRIQIIERQPVAFVYGRGLNMIDNTGYIMPIPPVAKRWDLPVISGIRENIGVQGAVTSSTRLRHVVELLADIGSMKSPLPQLVSELDCSNPDYLQIRLTEAPAVIRVNYHRNLPQLFVAAGYLHDYTNFKQLKKIDYIDLRFDGQIVVREKKG